MRKYKSGLADEQRKIIRAGLVRFTNRHAFRLGCPPEAIVQEIRYWQQSNADWRTNPTKTQKAKSFKHYRGVCQLCSKKISTIADATFHHWKRGVPDLHEPKNMIPLCKIDGCHETLHNAPPGSFTVGSMSKKRIADKS